MGNIYVNECANNTESQNWTVMADGRIALEPTQGSEYRHRAERTNTHTSPEPFTPDC